MDAHLKMMFCFALLGALAGCATGPDGGELTRLPFLEHSSPQPVAIPYMAQSGAYQSEDAVGTPRVAEATATPLAVRPGVPVPGRPGMLKSPGGGNVGWIDAVGFRPGTVLKDPYTGLTVMVPYPETP